MMLVCIKSSVATKKGKSEGTTEFAHKANPLFTAGKFELENNKRLTVKPINTSEKKFRFIFTT